MRKYMRNVPTDSYNPVTLQSCDFTSGTQAKHGSSNQGQPRFFFKRGGLDNATPSTIKIEIYAKLPQFESLLRFGCNFLISLICSHEM